LIWFSEFRILCYRNYSLILLIKSCQSNIFQALTYFLKQFNEKWWSIAFLQADIVMTSLKINSGREKVIDFSVPFLDTGITILVAKKTGIISPTAFLEPFDTASWMLVALVAIQVSNLLLHHLQWFHNGSKTNWFLPKCFWIGF